MVFALTCGPVRGRSAAPQDAYNEPVSPRRIPMSRFVLLAAAIVCLGGLSVPAAPGLKEKDDKSDLKKLEGDWKVESWVQHGQTVHMDATWNFRGDKYTLKMPSNLEEGSIKID